MNFIILILAVIICGLPLFSSGQPEDLKELLKDKFTFNEVTQTVDQYLATTPDTPEKEVFAKHYRRWANFQSMHLGPNGEFVNIAKRTYDAVKRMAPPDPGWSANGDWTFVGPNSSVTNNPDADILGLGRVDRLAFHPTNSNIIYAGTPAGGLWKTTNGGTSWTCLTNFIPSLGISGIVISHADPNTIFVLTGDGDSYYDNTFLNLFGYVQLSVGVLVSYDGGTTWQQTGPLSQNDFTGYRLVQHPTNANILMAATSDGLYRNTNGGSAWTQEITGRIYDIEFKPGDPSRVYASGVASFYYSTNTGADWNSNSTFNYPLCANGRVEIAVPPSLASKVYLLAGPKTTGNTFCGFYISTDNGLSFTRSTNTPNILGDETGLYDQSIYDLGITVKPTNDQVIITGGLIIYKSTNGGSTFSYATTYRESGGNYIHPDIHDVAYNPLDGNLYTAGDGGVHRSTDDGVSWTDLSSGIATTQFYYIDDYNSNQYVILGGCQDNGIKYRNSNTTQFYHIFCCDGGDVTIDYSNQNRGFATVNTSIIYYTNFTTTAPTEIIFYLNNFFPKHVLNSSNPDILYYSYSNIYKYVASTNTHTPLTSAAHGYWAITTCQSNALRLYAAGGMSAYATTGELYTSPDGGSNWSTLSSNPGFPSNFPRISDIGVSPVNSNYVYVTFSGYTSGLKVYYSGNTGTTWANYSYDLPNVPVWSIEVDASNNVYVGTDIGVFYKAAGATAWEPYYNNLPNVPVTDLAMNQESDQLLAATFGRGIWKATLRDPCPTTATITTNVSGQYFRSASVAITMSSDVVGGEGTDAVLRTPGYIQLTPGFQANGDIGNDFLAYLGPCDSGVPPDNFGPQPIYPEELFSYSINYTRSLGTLEVPITASRQKELILRLFQEGNVRIILASSYGRYIRDVANFTGNADQYTLDLDTAGLDPGTYYVYLIVNDQVDHLQELVIQ